MLAGRVEGISDPLSFFKWINRKFGSGYTINRNFYPGKKEARSIFRKRKTVGNLFTHQPDDSLHDEHSFYSLCTGLHRWKSVANASPLGIDWIFHIYRRFNGGLSFLDAICPYFLFFDGYKERRKISLACFK